MLRKGFAKNEEAVSPVIGVILMVAITVILAAVIASFVFGLGSNAPKSAPSAQLSISDASEALDSTSVAEVFTISHQGGDSLKCGDLKILVYNGTTLESTLTYDTSAKKFNDSGSGYDLYCNSSAISDNDRLEPGEIIVFAEEADNVPTGELINIKVLHTPSNQPILDGDVQVW